MLCSEAERIYKAARMLNLDDDVILAFEGFNRAEYLIALKPFLEKLPKKEITMGWEEPEPDNFYCWQGTRIPQWFE
jgi:hypothetical protein